MPENSFTDFSVTIRPRYENLPDHQLVVDFMTDVLKCTRFIVATEKKGTTGEHYQCFCTPLKAMRASHVKTRLNKYFDITDKDEKKNAIKVNGCTTMWVTVGYCQKDDEEFYFEGFTEAELQKGVDAYQEHGVRVDEDKTKPLSVNQVASLWLEQKQGDYETYKEFLNKLGKVRVPYSVYQKLRFEDDLRRNNLSDYRKIMNQQYDKEETPGDKSEEEKESFLL